MKQNVEIFRHDRIWALSLFAHVFCLLAITVALMSCNENDGEVKEPWENEVDKLSAAVAVFNSLDHAIAQGYDNEFTGYRSQMGFHYLNGSLLDDQFELEKPEVLMYAPDSEGNMKFVGVEYAVPITDLLNPPPAPEGFTGDEDVWEINHEFSVWTLHVWVGIENPHGIFASHNPELP